MHALSEASFSCLNVCATAHAKAPKNVAFISKIVNKMFLLIAANLSVENGRYDISADKYRLTDISVQLYLKRIVPIGSIIQS